MTESSKTPLTIDVISDAICPWCYIGKARLEKALAMRPDIDATVRWRAFQLNPDMPVEGADRRAYLEQKFGGPERAEAIYARIGGVLDSEALPHAIDRIPRTPNTLAAHTLIRWSEAAGVQDAVVNALFKAYFVDGEDIGDHAVLARIAGDSGMDAAVVRKLLDDGVDRDAAAREDAQARSWQVSGVPCFVIGGRVMVEGAQDPATLTQAIDKALELATETPVAKAREA